MLCALKRAKRLDRGVIMDNIIIGIIIAVIVGLAAAYVIKAKKKGQKSKSDKPPLRQECKIFTPFDT